MFAKLTFMPMNHTYSIFDQSVQQDTSYEDEDLGLKIEYKWRPQPTNELSSDFYHLLHPDATHSNRIAIVGHALWPLEGQDTFDHMLDTYKTNMTRLLIYIQNLKSNDYSTKILWSLQDPVAEKKVSKLLNVSNTQIDDFNDITENLIESVSIKDLTLLTSMKAITKSLQKYMNLDGIHSSDYIVEYKSQILVNYMCNRIFGFDSTCCSTIQTINVIQLIFILSALLTISAYIVYLVKPYLVKNQSRINKVKWQKVPQCDNTLLLNDQESQDSDDQAPYLSSSYEGDRVTLFEFEQIKSKSIVTVAREELLINTAKLCMAILFMFICDRTNFFMKENKYFTLANFILPIIYMFALGIFFTEAQPDATTMLSRRQTDEWKGWMQLVVLIYNLSSAQNNLRIYMLIRVLLSSYLFLTGYGHFTYFYKTGDTSIRRLCQVCLRLNLIVVCLCLCINRPYQYYYFVPLVTFWFIVVFLFMKIKPIKNHARPTANDHFWIIFKLIILLGLITMLYLSEVFFEKVFLLSPWGFLFATGQDYTNIKDWWHHWSVDRYSVLAGMIYGLVHWTVVAPYLAIRDSEMLPRNGPCHSRESSQGSQDELVLRNPLLTFQDSIKPNGSFIITLALFGISFYSLFAATCSEKSSCDEIHAYVSFVPIISYLVLRNSSVFMRSRHSILFAFIGRMSLELSVCQYHIWLAAGQQGLLVLVPSNPTLNLVITSIIFCTTAHKLNAVIRNLTRYATSIND